MTITFTRKEIYSNGYTDLVWCAYQNALKDFNVIADAMAPDEKTVKTNLEIEGKTELSGYFPSFLRFTGISHAARYYLEETTVNVGEWSDVFYKQLQTTLLKELASAVYEDTSLKKISDATTLMSVKLIDNHYMLICEVILRMVADALDEQLIKNRTAVSAGDDKAVTRLKIFVRNVKGDTEQMSKLFGKTHGNKLRVSSIVAFLDQLIDQEASQINVLIYNTREVNAPKESFKLVSSALENIQKKLRGYLLVYLDLISKELNNKTLLTQQTNLSINLVLPFYTHVINELLKQCNGGQFMGQEDEVLVEINKAVFIEDNIKIIGMFTKKANSLRDAGKKKSAIHSINDIKKLFILDEQLNAIKDAVREFITFAELGGWIPIFLKVIRPEVLSNAINKFSETCQRITSVCTAYLNQNSDYSIGLACLPPFEWENLNTINMAIRKLTSMEMMNRIYRNFNTQINGLVQVEQLLLRHNLIGADQHIISTRMMARQLPEAVQLTAAVSAGTDRRLLTNVEELSHEGGFILPPSSNLTSRSRSWNDIEIRIDQQSIAASNIAPSSAMFSSSQSRIDENIELATSSLEEKEEENTIHSEKQKCCVMF